MTANVFFFFTTTTKTKTVLITLQYNRQIYDSTTCSAVPNALI